MRRISQRLRFDWLSTLLATALVGLALDGFWGQAGPRDLLLLRHHSSMLTTQRDALLADNASLRQRIARLKSDDSYLQRMIRQELGYARPGELVYRFAPSEPH